MSSLSSILGLVWESSSFDDLFPVLPSTAITHPNHFHEYQSPRFQLKNGFLTIYKATQHSRTQYLPPLTPHTAMLPSQHLTSLHHYKSCHAPQTCLSSNSFNKACPIRIVQASNVGSRSCEYRGHADRLRKLKCSGEHTSS